MAMGKYREKGRDVDSEMLKIRKNISDRRECLDLKSGKLVSDQ